ncbi:MAG: hypothetical protein EBU90_01645 [Proteobacteria bacterium]|nr:hypothetical protein [Pseudomonadota bacterium]
MLSQIELYQNQLKEKIYELSKKITDNYSWDRCKIFILAVSEIEYALSIINSESLDLSDADKQVFLSYLRNEYDVEISQVQPTFFFT